MATDELEVLTRSEMLQSFMGTEELQSTVTYCDSHSATLENETSLTLCGERESVSSSSRGSIRSLSSVSDDLSGKNKLVIYTASQGQIQGISKGC